MNRNMIRTAMTTIAALALCITTTQAGVISFNMFDGHMNASEVAGAPGVSVAKWNNSKASSGDYVWGTGVGGNAIVDDSGTSVTGLTATYDLQAGRTIAVDDGTGYRPSGLFNWTMRLDHTDPVTDNTLTISGIPFAQYEVYIYVSASNAGNNGVIRVKTGSTTKYIRGDEPPSSPDNWSYVEVDYTNAQSPGQHAAADDVPVGSYLVLDGLTSSSLTIDIAAYAYTTPSGGSNQVYLGGYQIVEVPEPATLALMAAGSLMMIRRRRAGATTDF